MTKRQWILVAGTLVLAACSGTGTGVCVNPVVASGVNHNADEVGIVDCTDTPINQARWGAQAQPRPSRPKW